MSWGTTYEIDGYAECAEDMLLGEEALQVGRRERVVLGRGYVVPAGAGFDDVTIEFEGVCTGAFVAQGLAGVGGAVYSTLEEEEAVTL